MADKKKTPTVRDDIEKALDYAPLVGIALGAYAGNKLGIRKANKIIEKEGMHTWKALPAFAGRVAGGTIAGGVAGKVVSNESNKRRRK